MFVISAGLQKSGSGLYFNLTNDLLIATGHEDIRYLKKVFNLEEILQHHNCNVGELTWKKLKKILSLHFNGKTFVIKTHDRPTVLTRFLINLNMAKVTYIYRDPRDVVLSALDHGKKIREEGQNHTFASCWTIENTVPQVLGWLENSVFRWLSQKKVLRVKFEDLLQHPENEMFRLADFLNLNIDHIDVKKIIYAYEKKNLDTEKKDFLHFNQGIIGRFKSAFKKEELKFLNCQFEKYLGEMGYKI